ncbi:hypothetical protein BKA69DRAFT_408922 [Paraphysoderma sedebokerense]|nr:hypothetical protein BKA69DRAFT_408922 [Paraphysoderma sedebokerense]
MLNPCFFLIRCRVFLLLALTARCAGWECINYHYFGLINGCSEKGQSQDYRFEVAYLHGFSILNYESAMWAYDGRGVYSVESESLNRWNVSPIIKCLQVQFHHSIHPGTPLTLPSSPAKSIQS